MNTVIAQGRTGWKIEPRIDASGDTTWLWRVWHVDAEEAASALSFEAAQAAVVKAHTRISA